MDLDFRKPLRRLGLTWILVASTGCVAPLAPVPTVWQKLGIPQAGARLRDGLVNRNGNTPKLEKKPPVLALSDPANLEAGKPEMIKAAAEIKQDQDLKKQKIKAIKFLAQVNCGCYNKDDKVEAAFLAALDDCDPDVRIAAVAGLKTTTDNCDRCRSRCADSCYTLKIQKKLQDMAYGSENGCCKEPEAEIRKAAMEILRNCKPPLQEPIKPEELIPPAPTKDGGNREGGIWEGVEPVEALDATGTSFRLKSDEDTLDSYSSRRRVYPLRLTSNSGNVIEAPTAINNPEELIDVRIVICRSSLGELLVQLPAEFYIRNGLKAVVVDKDGNRSTAEIMEVGGRRVLLALDDPRRLQLDSEFAKFGLVAK